MDMHIHSLTVIGQRRLIHRWIGLTEMNHILLIYAHQTDALPLFCLAFLTKKTWEIQTNIVKNRWI